MMVIVADHTPPYARGMLKRWFIEPRPNVFVGTVNRKVREKVINYVLRNAPEFGMLIISSEPNCQGFSVRSIGETKRKEVKQTGLYLIAEKWEDREAFELPDGEEC